MKLTNAQIYTLRRLSGGVNINSVVTEKRRGNAGQDQGYSPMIFLHHLFLSCFVSGWWTMYIRGREHALFYAVTLTDTGKQAAATKNIKD